MRRGAPLPARSARARNSLRAFSSRLLRRPPSPRRNARASYRLSMNGSAVPFDGAGGRRFAGRARPIAARRRRAIKTHPRARAGATPLQPPPPQQTLLSLRAAQPPLRAAAPQRTLGAPHATPLPPPPPPPPPPFSGEPLSPVDSRARKSTPPRTQLAHAARLPPTPSSSQPRPVAAAEDHPLHISQRSVPFIPIKRNQRAHQVAA